MSLSSNNRWARIKDLFHAALERPPQDRAVFLQAACADDETRAEIERLLAAHLAAGTFIEASPVACLGAMHTHESLTGQRLGHYLVEQLLGAGGMGVVYAARDTELERIVALKIVSSDAADAQVQLRREAQRASQLNHPNICTIHEVGTSGGMTYFVMEHVDGQTLSALVARRALPVEGVLRYGTQIADALAHAHSRGLIHRDLKSANVMVTAQDRVKVLDFGLACPAPPERVTELTRSREPLSRDESIVGTLPYMAPELLRGRPADTRSDVWALGVVLYEMAAGRRPFDGATGFELGAAIVYQPSKPLPADLPSSLQAVIRRSLEKDPADRYVDAGEAAAALEAIRAELAAGSANQRECSRSMSVTRGVDRLPAPRTSFIGRADETASIVREIESSRLVTLTGVGGSGKTRLALRVAEQARSSFADGVRWVDLAPLADGTRVDEAVAATLGILNAQRSPREALLEYLVDRRLLLVLDNCEHLLGAVADLADTILARSEGAHILVTSREGLGVAGEQMRAVPSLSFPTGDAARDPRALADSDAVRLFAARAAAVRAGFSITAANGPVVLDICRRLDGIPLAIELAAARARLLSVEQIRARLEDCLALLAGRGRALPRHQTLGAALQWSYDLLTPQEQRVLRVFSAFQGGWTLSGAAAVCGESVGEQELLDLTWRLVEKSLVEVVHTDGIEARYRLLEIVRQFAFDRLVSASEAPDTLARHADYYLGRFETAAADLLGPREADIVAALDLELDNLLAALHQHTQIDSGAARVLRAIADGWLFWVSRGHIALARGVLSQALQGAAETSALTRARAQMASSMFARFAGAGPQALQDAGASVSLYEQSDEADASGLAFALFQRATARATFAPDAILAREDLERGVRLSNSAGDGVMMGICLNMLSLLALAEGDATDAEVKMLEALATARASGSPYLLILYMLNLADQYSGQGRWAESVAFNREAIELVQASGNRHFAPGCVLVVAQTLAASGDLPAACRLAGAAFGIGAQIGEALSVDELVWTKAHLGSGVGVLPEDYTVMYAGGRTLTFDAAIAEAQSALRRWSPPVSPPPDGAVPPT